MKTSNVLLLLCFLIAVSCGKDDTNDDNPPQPEEVMVNLTVDIDGLANLPDGSEASDFVNFGQAAGVPNSEFTSSGSVNDMITWDDLSVGNDVILYDYIEFIGGDSALVNNPEAYFEDLSVDSGVLNPDEEILFSEAKLKIINADPNVNLEVKYNLWFWLERDGNLQGPYYIDPKIRINGQ